MRCTGCGQALTEGSAVCLRCGTPVTPGSQVKSVDVALLPEPVPPSGDNWVPSYGAPASPYQSSTPTQAPPPPTFDSAMLYANVKTAPKARALPRRAVWLAAIVVLIAAIVSFGVIYTVHAKPSTAPGGSLSNSTNPVPANANCVLPDQDQAAAKNLQNVELSSGLRDPANKDFRPVDSTFLFTVGQTIYVTFTVNSSAAATLSADWCWGGAGNRSHFQLPVSHSQNVNGYFNLRNLDAAAVGTGVVVLRWNNAVAYAAFFQVK